MEKVIAIIPARGGSKGIQRKNIKLLAGKPLIAYSIEIARNSPSISQVVVSTEDEEIAEIAEKFGAEVFWREKDLALDTVPLEPVLEKVVNQLQEDNCQPDWLVLLQPTSPFREPDDIEKALQKLREQDGDSLVSVCSNHNFLWQLEKNGFYTAINYDYRCRPRRQEMQQYTENGSIYITKRRVLMEQHCRLGDKVVAYMMTPQNSLEIDTPWDWWLAEKIVSVKADYDQ